MDPGPGQAVDHAGLVLLEIGLTQDAQFRLPVLDLRPAQERAGVVLHHLDQLGDPVPQPGPAGFVVAEPGELQGQPQQLVAELPQEHREDLELAREVLVDRRPGPAGGLTDRLHRGRLVAVAGEQVPGRFDDLGPGPDAVRGQQRIAPVRGPALRARDCPGPRRPPVRAGVGHLVHVAWFEVAGFDLTGQLTVQVSRPASSPARSPTPCAATAVSIWARIAES